MSKVHAKLITCPACRHEWIARLFESLNGERIPGQVADIVSATFEQQPCPSCGVEFRPEHTMLYSELSKRVWIVMHPPADQPRYALIERGVELVMERNFAAAPPLVADSVRGIKPRLVFGQAMLTEALRVQRAGLSPSLLECAKLLALRRNLADIMSRPPSQLAFEAIEPDGRLRCGLLEIRTGIRIGQMHLPADAIAEVRASQPVFEERYPELFSRPYVSVCRYLHDAL